jgi:CDP-diacylglycerol--glycerol-3-phosphate 3-phosphatidyltransferase
MANALTVFRLIMAPVFLGLIMWANPAADQAALIVFAAAAVTDLFDGYVARRFHQVTEAGKLIDPIADRALIAAAVIGLFYRGSIPPVAFVCLIARDGIMALGFWLGRKLDKPLVRVNLFGKITNFYLMSTIVALLFGLAVVPSSFFAWAFYLGVVLYLASALVYIVQEVMVLRNAAKGDLLNES